MNEFDKAKNRYNSIEIPQELGNIVQNVIDSRVQKKTTRVCFMRLAPVAVCALICISVGVNYLFDGKKVSDEEVQYISENSAMQPASAEARIVFDTEESKAAVTEAKARAFATYNSVIQVKIDESINECVKLEKTANAYGEVQEIYSDEEILSYSVTTYPSVATNFYNVKKSDGSDIGIESILGYNTQYNSENCKFYIKERDKLVVIHDGEEIEIILD